MHDVIKGCIETLDQAEKFLNSVSDEAYIKIVKPFFISSSGEHMRHIMDHFQELKKSWQSGIIDFNNRRRGSRIEQSRKLALVQIEEIKQWLSKLDENELNQPLSIKTEVAISETLIVEVTSTLARELVFASSHAVHHYSSIATAIQMQEVILDKNFGIAPATATYLRSGDESCVRSPG